MSRISPAMADGGRCFTNFMSNCQYNALLAARFNVQVGLSYRQFLQHNSAQVMNEMRQLKVCTSFDQKDCSFCLRPE